MTDHQGLSLMLQSQPCPGGRRLHAHAAAGSGSESQKQARRFAKSTDHSLETLGWFW